MKNSFIIFIKGIIMGFCDVIPGISGGTIAFITGIYERLINGVENYNPLNLTKIFKNPKSTLKSLDLQFFIPLLLGLSLAFIVGSIIIPKLLEIYFTFTISFFVGLILASSVLIYKEIKDHSKISIFFGFLGLIFGILISFLVPINPNPSLIYIFLCGFLAITAMFLPGISGAFILLILGKYEFMLNVLHNLKENLSYFFSFIVGAILGALTISKIISVLLKKFHSKTLYLLLGLVLGSLLAPIKKINFHMSFEDGSIALIFIVFGILTVYLINKLAEKTTKKDFIGIE